MIDFDGLLFAPIYDTLGVEATLTTVDGIVKTITVKDETSGVILESGNNNFQMATSKPAACVRVSELSANGLARKDLSGAAISFNGNDWKVIAIQPKPVSSGPGEFYLILQSAP